VKPCEETKSACPVIRPQESGGLEIIDWNFDRVLACPPQVSEWADHKSRLLFLTRVSSEWAGVTGWWLPKVSFGHETDEFLGRMCPIDIESTENDCSF
jgi:hypothetical protein